MVSLHMEVNDLILSSLVEIKYLVSGAELGRDDLAHCLAGCHVGYTCTAVAVWRT